MGVEDDTGLAPGPVPPPPSPQGRDEPMTTTHLTKLTKSERALLWGFDQYGEKVYQSKDEDVTLVLRADQFEILHRGLRALILDPTSPAPRELGKQIHKEMENYLVPGGARVYLATVIEAYDESQLRFDLVLLSQAIEEARQYLVEAS